MEELNFESYPQVYRVMTVVDGLPAAGRSARSLGVRIVDAANESDAHGDIQVDLNGSVSPSTGGMSVAPSWRDLPLHRIPVRLNEKLQLGEARGKDSDACWRIGNAKFESTRFGLRLFLEVDSPTHGTIQPLEQTTFEKYEHDLVSTRMYWTINED